MSALSTLGVRIGRHAGIYGAGSALAVVIGLVNLAVLTRFLPPAEFGQYALYVVLSALLMLLYNLGSLKGSMRAVFGGDDDDDDEDEEEGEGEEREDQRRRTLGTALLLTALIAAAGTLAVWALSAPVADLLVHDAGGTATLLWAAAAGGLGAVWRVATNVPRRERRPARYVVLQTSRPVLVLAATVPLVAAGGGVEEAVLGLAIGSAVATLLSLAAIRGSWLPAFDFADVRSIMRRGRPYVPMVLSFWIIQNAGIFILAQYAPPSDVGIFRVAAGVAAVGSYAVSAFLRASGPLTKEPIHAAAHEERGEEQAGSLLATYFALTTVGLVLAFAVAAEVLVRIAPPSYADAAPLVPLIVLAFVLQGWFRVIYRVARFPRKKAAKVSLAVTAAIVFVGSAFAMTPELEAYGVALAMIIAFLVAAVGVLTLSQRGKKPIPFPYGRILAGVLIAASCGAAAALLGEGPGLVAVVAGAAAILAYPALLVATGVIPRAHLRPLREISAAALARRSPARNGQVDLGALDEPERAVLEVLVRHGQPVSGVAPLLGTSAEEVSFRFVAALRTLGGLGEPSEADGRIGSYLLSTASVADRDQIWRRLSAEGADPLETDVLLVTLERLRRAPPEAWRVR